mmetsp:Transcript_22224/g.21452  ORF Transcript_22224/g.21452 Transcript_22224/m.21452 type:complete len:89 (+) Transcript_22224:297-563(+)
MEKRKMNQEMKFDLAETAMELQRDAHERSFEYRYLTSLAALNGATTTLPSAYELELMKESRELELEARLDAIERQQEQQQNAFEMEQL